MGCAMITIDQDKLAELNRFENNKKIISQIEKLEQKLIRPMTAMINNTANDTDRQVFNDIKAQIAELRGKLL
jgi:hypothetical protein